MEEAKFKLTFPQAKQANSDQIEIAYGAAEDELVSLVGQSAVTDAASATPAEAGRAAKIIRSHSFLAIAFLYLNVKNLKKAQDAGSPATAQTIQNEYFTPKELAELADSWRSRAMLAVGPYLLSAEADTGGFAFVHPSVKTECC